MMKPLHLTALFLILLLTMSCENTTDYTPIVAPQRIVFSTAHGDLVFALYPEVAPEHVKQLINLTEKGIFDNSQVMRVIPNFIIQFSDSYRRAKPLTWEEEDVITPIKAEFTDLLKHTKGRLSMARHDDPDSATMSFSILLGDAPHLDEKYTIFGALESGALVVDHILSVPRNGEQLTTPVIVDKAYVVNDIEAYYEKHPKDPFEDMGNVQSGQAPQEDKSRDSK